MNRVTDKELREIYMQLKNGENIDLLEQLGSSDILNINIQSQEGRTLLELAMEEEEVDIIRLLVEKHINPFIRNVSGMNSMMLSASNDNIEVLRCLVSSYREKLCVEDENEMLGCAVTNNLIKNTEYLLEQGFDANGSYRDDPIIIWAIQSENVSLLKLLVENGASIHSCDNENRSPLFQAAAEGMLEIVKWLVSMKAEIDKTDSTGGTALMLACCYGQIGVVKELIRHNANINVKDDDGISPFMYSIEYGNIEVVDILLKEGADIHCIDNDGRGVKEYLLEIENDFIRKEMESVIYSHKI